MDVDTFELACSLARFYSRDMWTVYMTFVEHMLGETKQQPQSASASASAAHEVFIEDLERKLAPLAATLRSRRDEFVTKMYSNVFPLIEGVDLLRLGVFYNLLGDSESEFHMKAVRKLNSMG